MRRTCHRNRACFRALQVSRWASFCYRFMAIEARVEETLPSPSCELFRLMVSSIMVVVQCTIAKWRKTEGQPGDAAHPHPQR